MELKVQTPTLANAPENHSPRTPQGLGSRIYDRMPSVRGRGFQPPTWVRSGLWLHVTLCCSRTGNSEGSITTYFIARGAFLCISIKLHLPHLNLSSLCFHLSLKWHCKLLLGGDDMSHVSCAVPKISRVFYSLREENWSFVFRDDVNHKLVF